MKKYLSIIVIFLIMSCEDNEDTGKNCNLYEERGSLVSAKRTFQYSKESIASLAKSFYGIDESNLNIENGIDVYSVVYKSIGPISSLLKLKISTFIDLKPDNSICSPPNPTLSLSKLIVSESVMFDDGDHSNLKKLLTTPE